MPDGTLQETRRSSQLRTLAGTMDAVSWDEVAALLPMAAIVQNRGGIAPLPDDRLSDCVRVVSLGQQALELPSGAVGTVRILAFLPFCPERLSTVRVRLLPPKDDPGFDLSEASVNVCGYTTDRHATDGGLWITREAQAGRATVTVYAPDRQTVEQSIQVYADGDPRNVLEIRVGPLLEVPMGECAIDGGGPSYVPDAPQEYLGMWMHKGRGRGELAYTELSQREFDEMLARSPEELLEPDTTVMRIRKPGDVEWISEHETEIGEGDTEPIGRTTDGREIWWRLEGSIVRARDGSPQLLIPWALDETDFSAVRIVRRGGKRVLVVAP
jgi:hypothetical protein